MNHEQWLLVLAILGGLSETLSLIPQIKANGVFQMFYNCIKAIMPKKE